MGRFLKGYLWPLFAAIITTIICAVFFQTQRVLSLLKTAGGEISLSERISMTFYDLQHLGSLYGIFICIALLIALTSALFLSRKFPDLAVWIYAAAGAIGILVLLHAMKQAFFDVHIIAGARDVLGQILQMIAGALGGYVFWRMRSKLTISAQQAAQIQEDR